MTKAEVYKMVIDMQKKTGQGCSGIVKLGNDPLVSVHLDELVEEGVIKACDTGGSMGHSESNIFYMPTEGYNVWEGDDEPYNRHKGEYLHFVRFYLGILDNEDVEESEDDEDDEDNLRNLRRVLNPTMFDYIRNPELMVRYSEWLTKNQTELEIMRNLDDYYVAAEIEFTESEIEYVTTRSWYEDNETINQSKILSIEGISLYKEAISINKKLIGLYERSEGKENELEKSEKEIVDYENKLLIRKKLHRWFDLQDGDGKIQDSFNKELV